MGEPRAQHFVPPPWGVPSPSSFNNEDRLPERRHFHTNITTGKKWIFMFWHRWVVFSKSCSDFENVQKPRGIQGGLLPNQDFRKAARKDLRRDRTEPHFKKHWFFQCICAAHWFQHPTTTKKHPAKTPPPPCKGKIWDLHLRNRRTSRGFSKKNRLSVSKDKYPLFWNAI